MGEYRWGVIWIILFESCYFRFSMLQVASSSSQPQEKAGRKRADVEAEAPRARKKGSGRPKGSKDKKPRRHKGQTVKDDQEGARQAPQQLFSPDICDL